MQNPLDAVPGGADKGFLILNKKLKDLENRAGSAEAGMSVVREEADQTVVRRESAEALAAASSFQSDIEAANTAIDSAKADLEQAKSDITQAQSDLQEAMNPDVTKLTFGDTGFIAEDVVEKILADISYFNKMVAGSVIASDIAAAIANIVEAKVENLTVTQGAAIASAVINKLAAQLITSSRLQSDIDPVTKLMSVMDSQGFRLLDMTDPANPAELVRIGPSGVNLITLGNVTISSDGVSAKTGSFESLTLDGRAIPTNIQTFPRGVVSFGLFNGGYSRQLNARDQVIGLEGVLERGRVYKLSCSTAMVQTENGNCNPMLNLHYTTDGSYPGTNWGATTVHESTVGAFGGFRTLPGMEAWIDMRTHSQPTYNLRASVSLGNLANNGWVQVAAPVHRLWFTLEDMGSNFVDRGTPFFNSSGGGAIPIKTTHTKRYYATGWANYFRSGSRDMSLSKPAQGQASSYNRECFFFFDDMTADLAGATIQRITLRSWADHWYYSGGGTASWCWHGHYGSVPGSGQYANFMTTTSGWARGSAREININPNEFGAWQSGARRGFAFSTANTHNEYYGNFSPITGPQSPTFIEVQYER